MSITVEKFLNVVSDYRIGLVAGRIGIGRPVDWFHFVESAQDGAMVNENELVFINHAYLEFVDEPLALLHQLVEKNSSGVVVALDKRTQVLAPALLEFCDRAHFPLIEMAADADISSISKLLCIQLLESEKASRQLFSAMKNAISFPQKTGLYMPTFMQYGFKVQEHYTAAFIKVEDMAELPTSEIQWIVKLMEQQLLATGDKSFVLTMDDGFVFVFSNYSSAAIQNVLLKIIVLLRMKDYTFYAGMSLNVQGLEKLSQAYMQAKHVTELSEKKEWKNMLCNYDELGVYQLLLAIDNQGVKEEFYDNTLGKLVRSDEEKKTDYLEFLKVYFESNCSINETADRLFIHRNTAVYKIKKINELLDCDLSDIEVRVKLYLASMLRYVL